MGIQEVDEDPPRRPAYVREARSKRQRGAEGRDLNELRDELARQRTARGREACRATACSGSGR
jgi:hypothetical protein